MKLKNSKYADASHAIRLLKRIEARECTVGIMGLGYVGLPLALASIEAGFKVLGFDTNQARVDQLNGGDSGMKHISSAAIVDAVEKRKFEATNDFTRLSEADAILIAVPTPLTRNREPNLSFVEKSTQAIADVLRPGQLIVLESTTWPGTTREIMQPPLEANGLKAGKDFFLAFSPEREDPGND
jgi:UDP-N-acetyl-D-glucosamine dehydrogenase